MRVAAIRRVKLDEAVPVYDVTVDRTENFQLATGPYVHNSKDVADAVCGAMFAASKGALGRADTVALNADGDRLRTPQSRTRPQGRSRPAGRPR